MRGKAERDGEIEIVEEAGYNGAGGEIERTSAERAATGAEAGNRVGGPAAAAKAGTDLVELAAGLS